MKDLFKTIEQAELKKYPLLTCCMNDGILFPEKYKKSSFKIVFILKEPYADWDEKSNMPKDCDFDFFDIIRDLKSHYDEGSLNKTWLKVAAMAYSLKNSCEYTEKLKYEQVVEGLECVAWINLSKTPWKTTTKTDDDFKARGSTWEPYVKLQLEDLNPGIVFYGNTWDLSEINPIEPDKGWKAEYATPSKKYDYYSEQGKHFNIFLCKYKKTGTILVNGYHPELGNSAKWQTDFIKDYMKN